MSRTPHPNPPGRDPMSSRTLGDPPAVPPYPLRRGGRATPDRSQLRRVGASCVDTDYVGPAPLIDPATNAGVEVGTRGNNEPTPKTTQEYGDAVRESRGVRTRPVRPGRGW
jgi:hypothetical protein